jgi:hypothetical protein
MADDAQREALWIDRAEHWEQLSIKAAKQIRQRPDPLTAGRGVGRSEHARRAFAHAR